MTTTASPSDAELQARGWSKNQIRRHRAEIALQQVTDDELRSVRVTVQRLADDELERRTNASWVAGGEAHGTVRNPRYLVGPERDRVTVFYLLNHLTDYEGLQPLVDKIGWRQALVALLWRRLEAVADVYPMFTDMAERIAWQSCPDGRPSWMDEETP